MAKPGKQLLDKMVDLHSLLNRFGTQKPTHASCPSCDYQAPCTLHVACQASAPGTLARDLGILAILVLPPVRASHPGEPGNGIPGPCWT